MLEEKEEKKKLIRERDSSLEKASRLQLELARLKRSMEAKDQPLFQPSTPVKTQPKPKGNKVFASTVASTSGSMVSSEKKGRKKCGDECKAGCLVPISIKSPQELSKIMVSLRCIDPTDTDSGMLSPKLLYNDTFYFSCLSI